MNRSTTVQIAAFALLVPLAAGCGPGTSAAAQIQETVWRPVGAWSGRQSVQTESFLNQSGALRLHWQARNAAAATDGALRLTLHSAVSGRPLTVALDVRGNGRGTEYLPEDPRTLYVVVESADTDWQFVLEEGFAGTSP